MGNPSVATIKKLFALSQNRCAFPGCSAVLVDKDSGKVTGRVCHIKARSENGPRYDSCQNEEERHSFNNLTLMCPIHHDVIDADTESYSVERLKQIKKQHEDSKRVISEANDDIANQFIANIHCDKLIGLISQNQHGGQVAYSITNNFQDESNHVTKAYCMIIKEDILNIIKMCDEQSKVYRVFSVEKVTSLSDWKDYFVKINTDLNDVESRQLIQFYNKVAELNLFKDSANKTLRKLGVKPGRPFMHPDISRIGRTNNELLIELTEMDTSDLVHKLTILSS